MLSASLGSTVSFAASVCLNPRPLRASAKPQAGVSPPGLSIQEYLYVRTRAAAHEKAAAVFMYQDQYLLQLAIRGIPPRGLRAHGPQEASLAAVRSSSHSLGSTSLSGRVNASPRVLWQNKTHEDMPANSYVLLSYHTSVQTTTTKIAERRAAYGTTRYFMPGTSTSIHIQEYFWVRYMNLYNNDSSFIVQIPVCEYIPVRPYSYHTLVRTKHSHTQHGRKPGE